jgi:hypothetical protein
MISKKAILINNKKERGRGNLELACFGVLEA